jgi:hypothetical protein
VHPLLIMVEFVLHWREFPGPEAMSQQNLCFYSMKCRFCQAFLEELSRSPYSREFRFVCVDPKPGVGRPPLPPYVKAVPTLMIVGEDEPRTDSGVMNWLSERRLLERDDAVAKRSGGPGSSDGPLTCSSDMFSAAGDEGFAFISEISGDQKPGQMVRMAANMASINDIHRSQFADTPIPAVMGLGQGSSASYSGGGGPHQDRTSKKVKAFDDALAAYQSSRTIDTPQGPRRT